MGSDGKEATTGQGDPEAINRQNPLRETTLLQRWQGCPGGHIQEKLPEGEVPRHLHFSDLGDDTMLTDPVADFIQTQVILKASHFNWDGT